MQLKNIPDDINVELLLSYLPPGSCKVVMKGLHKRNSYNDIIDVEERTDGTLCVGVGRNSLYNALPEFMFHPIDRFDNLPKSEEKERFAEEYEQQEREKELAYRFFAPVDILLLCLRMDVREKLREYTEHNKVLYEIIGDRLTDGQRNNRFVKQTIPFLVSCKTIRGDKTLLTLLLRKVLMEEGLRIELHRKHLEFSDQTPKYDCTTGASVGDCYAGDAYDEDVTVYDVHYWSDEDCDERFLQFLGEIEVFRLFVQDYFMSVDSLLYFNICHDEAPLRLSDDIFYNYLNYNTNI